MIPVKHIDPDDLALYAMQLLPPDETEEMTLHLQHSAEARRVLSEILSDLSVFAHSAEMHSPPALARQRLMKHVAREKKVIPPDPIAERLSGVYAARPALSLVEDEPVRRSSPARILPWVGWALAAGLGGLSVMLYQQRTQLDHKLVLAQENVARTSATAASAQTVMDTLKDPGAVHFTLTSSEVKPPPSGRLTYVAEKGALVLMASNLQALPPYKTYELWLVPQDGHDPIPAGTFRPDAAGFASVVLPQLPTGVAAKTFAVTIEDGDGSQTPTMPMVLKGISS